jgi:hypothetical protein
MAEVKQLCAFRILGETSTGNQSELQTAKNWNEIRNSQTFKNISVVCSL